MLEHGLSAYQFNKAWAYCL